jgi:hypothetical protein
MRIRRVRTLRWGRFWEGKNAVGAAKLFGLSYGNGLLRAGALGSPIPIGVEGELPEYEDTRGGRGMGVGVVNVLVPMAAAVVDILTSRKEDVAKQAGVSPQAVQQVGSVLGDYLTRDQKAQQAMMDEMERARRHDVDTRGGEPPIVLLLRGIVRPLITLSAFVWYVTARAYGIPLSGEDYALIGGVVAFWFGFRSFEKR